MYVLLVYFCGVYVRDREMEREREREIPYRLTEIYCFSLISQFMQLNFLDPVMLGLR